MDVIKWIYTTLLSSGYIQLKICKAFCQTPKNDSHFKNTQSHSDAQDFPINQRSTDEYFQLQDMFSS